MTVNHKIRRDLSSNEGLIHFLDVNFDYYDSPQRYGIYDHLVDYEYKTINKDSIKLDLTKSSLYSYITGRSKINSIYDYVIFKLCDQVSESDVKISIERDYYNDELKAEITNDNFINEIQSLYSLNESRWIDALLIKEYGRILPSLKDREYSLLEFDIKTIKLKDRDDLIDSTVEKYKYLYSKKKLNIPILCRNVNGVLKLVDGYHRYTAAKSLNYKKINCIYCD